MNRPESLTSLTSIEAEEREQYRSLSVWAVVAMLLGWLSVVALVHPAAWGIPVLAVVCSSWALHRIARDPDTLSGRPLALLGLVLGLFFLGWAPTTFFADRWLIRQEARHFSEQWVNAILAGQLGVAYQATLPVRDRQPKGTDLDAYYQRNDLQRAERDAYFNEGLPEQLVRLEGRGRCEYAGNLGMTFDRTYTLTSPRFEIYADDANEPVLRVQLEVIREDDEDGVYWTVIRISDADVVDRELAAQREH